MFTKVEKKVQLVLKKLTNDHQYQVKKQQTYKPGSVVSFETFYHLSRQSVARLLQRPTPRQRASSS